MMQNDKEGLIVQPWRQAYEAKAMLAWSAAAAYQLLWPLYAYMSLPAFIVSIVCVCMAGMNAYDVHRVFKRRIMLFEENLMFVPIKDFNDRVDAFPTGIYLGNGWEWTAQQTQWAYDLIRSDIEKAAPPAWYVWLYSKFSGRRFNTTTRDDESADTKEAIHRASKGSDIVKDGDKDPKGRQRGLSWIHGMQESSELYFPINDAIGNTLITGTTRSGKTVLYRMLTRQIIRKGECLFVFDPKGDGELLEIMLEAAKAEGRLDQFVFFNPAFAAKSHRIDPFANYQEPSQLASRVEPLIPSSGPNGDSFSAFSWGVMESILSAMDMINIRPSLLALRGVIERGPDELLYECIIAHCERLKISDFKAQISAFEKSIASSTKGNDSPKRILAAARFYRDVVYGIKPNSAIDGLLNFYEHNREHASKMLASLMPILKQLTTGELSGLLSPDANDANDPRPITSFDAMIRQKSICYIGLHALGDPKIAKAIGSIYMSDLVASAASRYAHGGSGEHKVFLLVDEASNAVNSSYLELLNKGSGAGFINFAATQTVPDFVEALGSDSAAEKALGNFNNLISLRVINESTKAYVSESIGMASVRTAQITQNTSVMGGNDNPLLYNGTYGTRTTDTEAPLIDPQLLGRLPNLEFVANISSGRILKGRFPILTAKKDGSAEDLWNSLPWMVDARSKGFGVGGNV